MKDNSSDAINIDNEGFITYPARPCFHGGCTTDTAGGSIAPFDYGYVNRGSHYNASNDRFICPCDGVYFISVFGMSHDNQSTQDIAIRKNGSDYNGCVPYTGSASGTYHHFAGTGLVSCSENDYLQVYVGSGSIYGHVYGRHSGFTVFLVA